MTTEVLALFFALSLLGNTVVLAVSLLRPAGRVAITEIALPLMAAVAVGATAGSLYFSEIAGFVPCELCWFQRIAMYPLAVIAPLAAARRDIPVVRYIRIIAVIGLAVALYHSQLQAFPDQGSFCELANPCTSSPITTMRWITIPHMSALSFGAIATLATLQQAAIPTTGVPK